MRKDTLKNIIKIVKCLQISKDWVWYRQIARTCNIDHKTVSRIIDKHLIMFLETQSMEPFNLKMVRLKQNTDINGILRYLEVKEKLEIKRH